MQNDDRQIRVRFLTKISSIRVTDTPFAVPLRLARQGLSQIINHLLNQSPPTPFDFLVHNTFLRTSLDKYTRDHDISQESVLTLEYVVAIPAPQPEKTTTLPDWVSALAGHPTTSLVTGCYDGNLRLHHGQTLSPQHTQPAHTGPIKALAYSEQQTLLSGGKDHALHLWQIQDESLQLLSTCQGPQSSVESLAFGPQGDSWVAGTWDGSLHYYTSVPPVKKQKTAGTSSTLDSTWSTAAHQDCISGVHVNADGQIVSAGWDRQVKCWDGATAQCTRTLCNTRPIAHMDVSVNQCIATAHMDHALRLWDARVQGSAVVQTLRSHKEWVSSVAWIPNSDTLLLSGGYDGLIKGWDIRSAVPLYTLHAHDAKVLTVLASPQQMWSGGSDGKLRSFATN